MLFSWQNRTERGSKCLSLPSHLHPAPNVTGSHDSHIAALAGRLWGHRRRVVATAIELPNRCQQLLASSLLVPRGTSPSAIGAAALGQPCCL